MMWYSRSHLGWHFRMCFKAQSSKLESLFSLKRVKRDIRASSFELSKMSPQVGLAVHLLYLIYYDSIGEVRVVRVPFTTKVPYLQVPKGIRYLNDKVVHWDS